MNDNRFAVRSDGAVEVSGPLTFQSVPQCLAESKGWLGDGSGDLRIDLRGVTLADSAGLALLLEWREQAEAAGRRPVFVNLPEQMRHLIEVSGLAAAFPPA